MHPQAFNSFGVICSLWTREANALDDTGEIPQVEKIMRLGWGRQQVLSGLLIHCQGRTHYLRGQAGKCCRKGKSKENAQVYIFILEMLCLGLKDNLYTTDFYRIVKCQFKILEKMVYIVFSSNSLIITVLKWRRKRGVTGFLPPPGRKKKQQEQVHQKWIPLWFGYGVHS